MMKQPSYSTKTVGSHRNIQPCAFCGETAALQYRKEVLKVRVQCIDCFNAGRYCWTRWGARRRWEKWQEHLKASPKYYTRA